MKTSFKMKWVLLAGLALALPGVLSGCGGGNSGSFNLGGGGGGGVNTFSGVNGSSPLTRNAVNIGTLTFAVDANGIITGQLTGGTIASPIRSTKAAAPVITSTSAVAPNGGFTLTFDVRIGGVAQTLTFTGTLSRSGGTASISAVSITSTVSGDFGVNFTVTVTGSGNPNPGSGTFTVSGGNATGGTIGGTADSLTAVRSGGKIIGVIFTFSSAGLGGVQTVTLSVNDNTEVTAKTYSIANDDASVGYLETPIGNPLGAKGWEATSGNVVITNITSSQATVSITGLTLTPTSQVNNTATGTVTVSGGGTLTIQ